MSPNPTPRAHRPLLSFSVEGLPAREELLFKSLVRLLDHRTHQHWAWRVENADLRVVGDRWQEPPVAEAVDRAVPLLVIGEAAPSHGPFLRLPLHAEALEAMLNRLGALVMHARGLGLAASGGRDPQAGAFRLLRWPPVALLDTPMRMKLATLLASRPASPQALQRRSGGSLQECADFLEALERAGLVAAAEVDAPAAGASGAVRPDSPARSAPAMPAPAREAVQPGLIARIRSRLGLLPPGPR